MSYTFKNMLVVRRSSLHPATEALRKVNMWFNQKRFQCESPNDLIVVIYSDAVGLPDRLTDLTCKDFAEKGVFEGVCHAIFERDAVKITKLDLKNTQTANTYLPALKHVILDQLCKNLSESYSIHWDPSILNDFTLLRHARNAGMVGDNEERVYHVTNSELKTTPAIPLDAPTNALLTDSGSLYGPRAPLAAPPAQEAQSKAHPSSAQRSVPPVCTQYKRVDPPSSVFSFGNGTPTDFKFNTTAPNPFGFPSSSASHVMRRVPPPPTSPKLQFGDGKTKKWF
jgi:hypothetical protein